MKTSSKANSKLLKKLFLLNSDKTGKSTKILTIIFFKKKIIQKNITVNNMQQNEIKKGVKIDSYFPEA